MIVSGYYGELIVTGDLTPRWICWFLSPCVSFCTSSTSFSSGSLSNATNCTEASDPVSKGKNKDKDKDELAWQRLWGSSQPPS